MVKNFDRGHFSYNTPRWRLISWDLSHMGSAYPYSCCMHVIFRKAWSTNSIELYMRIVCLESIWLGASVHHLGHVPYWWVNNPTLGEFSFTMIGRANIEVSKSNVAMNAWLPQASYPYGNFSDTSSFKVQRSKWNQNQMSLYPFVPHKISVLVELTLGHMHYLLTDVPPSQTPHPTMSSTWIGPAR
jgi:hypothetical protein